MGTNFYWIVDAEGTLPGDLGKLDHEEHFLRHIGKRSAAGLYCWTCGVPLVEPGRRKDGYGTVLVSADVVHGRSKSLSECPLCGQARVGEPEAVLSQGHAAGVELGFAQPLTLRKSGIASASSFSWAQEPARVLSILLRHPNEKIVHDQYDNSYIGAMFTSMLLSMPLWFSDAIGTDFS